MEFMVAVILLGAASLDFSGAMIILTALTLGVKNKDVCIFALIDFFGTVAIGALMDSSFLALITLAGYNMNFMEIILANCAWILISQLPAFALTIAVVLGKYKQMAAFVQEKMNEYHWFQKLKRILPKLLTVIILVAAVLLITDGLGYLLSGNRLVPIV